MRAARVTDPQATSSSAQESHATTLDPAALLGQHPRLPLLFGFQGRSFVRQSRDLLGCLVVGFGDRGLLMRQRLSTSSHRHIHMLGAAAAVMAMLVAAAVVERIRDQRHLAALDAAQFHHRRVVPPLMRTQGHAPDRRSARSNASSLCPSA